MIIDRYLISEIARPMLAVSLLVAIIFASYSAAGFLADAAHGMLAADTVAALMFLKTLIALEVLLPIALYLTVVVALGRLHADHEITALAACGIGDLRLLRPVLVFSLGIALVVGTLSLYVRPWAYYKSYQLEDQAKSEFDIRELEAEHFYQSDQSHRVIFMESIERSQGRMEQVFLQRDQGDSTRIIHARQGYKPPARQPPVLILRDGEAYDLDKYGRRDLTLRFDKLILPLETPQPTAIEQKRKASPTRALAVSADPEEVAEFQWRLSTPMSTILLGLLGVPLSRSAPRQGRFTKVLVAVALYAVYYNLGAIARTWVEQGTVAALPGIWWVDGLLAVMLGTWALRSGLRARASGASVTA